MIATLRTRGLSGIVGRLSEFVSWTSEAAPLPDAIVVEDFEQALRCYREKQASYVTLGGEVVTPFGVIGIGPGGASEGLLQTKREIRELHEAVAEAKGRLEVATGRRGEQKIELERVSSRLLSVRDRQHDLE